MAVGNNHTFFFFCTHTVDEMMYIDQKQVRMVGRMTSITRKGDVATFTFDDGTGQLEGRYWYIQGTSLFLNLCYALCTKFPPCFGTCRFVFPDTDLDEFNHIRYVGF